MKKNRIYAISLLVILSAAFVFATSLLRDEDIRDITHPANSTTVYVNDKTVALKASVNESGMTITNVTWFASSDGGATNITIATVNTTNSTNATADWRLVPHGIYNISIKLTNDTVGAPILTGLQAFNETNITADVEGAPQNTAGGSGIVVIKDITTPIPSWDNASHVISFDNVVYGLNISGTFTFKANIGANNVSTNATWFIGPVAGGTNITLGQENATNDLNGTYDVSAQDGEYIIYLMITNNSNYNTEGYNVTQNTTVTLDSTQPSVVIELSDSDNKIYSRSEITVTCTNSDATSGLMSEAIELENPRGTITRLSSTKTHTFKNDDTARTGLYRARCIVGDYAGNNITKEAEFNVRVRAGAPSVGPSGAAPGIDYYLDTRESTAISGREGTTKTFTLDGIATHEIVFSEVTETSATLIISSEPIEFTLEIGDSRDVDINGDGLDDVKVTLDGITEDMRASVTLVRLEGAAGITPTEPTEPTTPAEPTTTETDEGAGGLSTTVIIIIVIIIIIIGGYFLFAKKGKGSSKKGQIKFTRKDLRNI